VKLKTAEYDNNFTLYLEAEDQKDAALLARLGLMTRVERCRPCVSVSRDGGFYATLSFSKSRAADNFIGPRRRK
jgi:hypothetical protein